MEEEADGQMRCPSGLENSRPCGQQYVRCIEAATANMILGNPDDDSGERLPSATLPVPPWVVQEKVAMALPSISMLTLYAKMCLG